MEKWQICLKKVEMCFLNIHLDAHCDIRSLPLTELRNYASNAMETTHQMPHIWRLSTLCAPCTSINMFDAFSLKHNASGVLCSYSLRKLSSLTCREPLAATTFKLARRLANLFQAKWRQSGPIQISYLIQKLIIQNKKYKESKFT